MLIKYVQYDNYEYADDANYTDQFMLSKNDYAQSDLLSLSGFFRL